MKVKGGRTTMNNKKGDIVYESSALDCHVVSFMNNKVKVTGNRIRAFKFEERFKGHKNIPSTHFLKRDLGDYNQEHRRR